MAKTWSAIEEDFSDNISQKPKQTFAYYVYINGVPTKYDKVPNIPVKYRKIAVREETAESKKAYTEWLANSKSHASIYSIWKSELRKDFSKSVNDKQFELILNYAAELSDVYDIQANYVSELVQLFHSLTSTSS
jgi:hypothetical protein